MSLRGGGNALLLRFIESPHFTLFMCVSYLERYASNVGIHFRLCQKLRSYPTEEIEFFLPQLVQLQVTVETESLSLEDLLLELCEESTHCTLLVLWQLQAHLTELSDEPQSYGFQVCKRLYNKLQYILFSSGEPPSEAIRENTFPAMVLASSVAAAIGLPQLGESIKPLVVSQGRKQRSHVFHLASKLLKRSLQTEAVSSPDLTSDMHSAVNDIANGDGDFATVRSTPPSPPGGRMSSPPGSRKASSSKLNVQRTRSMDGIYRSHDSSSVSALEFGHRRVHSPAPSIASTASGSSFHESRMQAANVQKLANMSREEKVVLLKTNYFRCQTQFVYALQAISARLLQVPKQARLSALRAELAMLNKDLPAEVDIPLLLPTNTTGPNATQNRIVRISPAEATVLNSAERVPFLLLIEYLRDDVNFDPDTPANQELLTRGDDRRYIFDPTYWHDKSLHSNSSKYRERASSDLESDLAAGDLGQMTVHHTGPIEAAITPLAAAVSGGPGSSDPAHVASPRASDLSFASTYSSGPSTPTLSSSSTFTQSHNTNNNNSNVSFGDVTDIATHMRTAAIMLSQLETDSSKLPKDQVAAIKSRIIASMQAMEEHNIYAHGKVVTGEAGERKLENDLKTAGMSSSDDPSAKNLGEDWLARKERIRRSSPYGHLPNWDLYSVIAKTGNDLRQEAFACQLIQAFKKIWDDAGTNVWVKDMRILITNDSSGLVETITNGLSVHSIKKALTSASVAAGTNPKGTIASLSEHFDKKFGERDSDAYVMALDGFVRSLAAYSIICYILQIKDRHNGNILLDSEGHIIHIDFGFLLSNSPGRFGFEAAPFKLTQEYIDLMGGVDSPLFEQFRDLLKQAFKVLRKQAESIIILVEMMARDSNLPCFSSGAATALQLRQRFQLQLSESEIDAFVDNTLIQKSMGSIYTRLYDQYQLLTQGIYS